MKKLEGERVLHLNNPPTKRKLSTGGPQDSLQNKRQKLPQIQIPASVPTEPEIYSAHSLFSISSSEIGALFDDIDDNGHNSIVTLEKGFLAIRRAPPIPGLFFDPTVTIPEGLAESVMSFCMQTYFSSTACNQVMLFGRFAPPSASSSSTSGLPDILLHLLNHLSSSLKFTLPPETYELLFPGQPTMARQAIINLYQPGEGITSHVDLLNRYGDGVIGVSLGSGCVMHFHKVQTTHVEQDTRWDVYLPERSVVVLSTEARYDWKHGIEERKRDPVLNFSAAVEGSCALALPDHDQGAWTWMERGVRMSVTYRWLLPGADVVGDIHDAS